MRVPSKSLVSWFLWVPWLLDVVVLYFVLFIYNSSSSILLDHCVLVYLSVVLCCVVSGIDQGYEQL